ncbi:DNA ligase [Paenibacillus polysaccharolyticus]|uniref:DNA ligase n=1 Tax=Paenibacillus polysaccharolyticus TaxID=582692 RepID=UPI00203D6F18|nr:DNA ligase [Paenibacillus polysaccharolyticus]MCM3131961.1 DNA ligase [Paenibacillus polysaccharolyticus]
MNISSMIRGLMGDSKPGNAKPLELKEGQVVRGSVVSISDDGGEAVLQIQGVQVRAKLETPLRPGETTLLQVQPPGENGITVMKPVAGSLAELPQASLNNLLQEVGLADTKDNRELLLAMQRSGLPLTKDNIGMVQNMMAAKPAQVSVEEWVQATGIAFQRGLPVTGETVRGLHQTVFGPPLHQLLSDLADQLESLLSKTEPGKPLPGGEATGSKVGLATGQAGASATFPNVAAQPEDGAPAVHASRPGVGTPAASPLASQSNQVQNTHASNTPVAVAGVEGEAESTQQQVKGNVPPNAGQTNSGMTGAEAVAKGVASQAETAGKGNAGIPAGTVIPGEGPPRAADAGQVVSRPGTPGAAEVAASRASAGQPEGAAVRTDGRADTPAAAAMPSAAGQAAPTAPTPAQLAPKLLALLDALRSASTAAPAQPGAATQAAPAAQQGGQAAAAAAGSPQTLPAGADAQPAGGVAAAPTGAAAQAPVTHGGDPWVGRVLKLLGAEHEQQAVHGAAMQPRVGEAASPANTDTLKGLLLQLASSDSAPAALKDAANQAIQYLTGQQLLLTTDRGATFAQMHWFIPITGPDGEQTASVQIQSRRGQRGELDASNCRLLFDLDMRSLGHTLVDVHVVNNIVSLRVLNDREEMGVLLESGREMIHQSLDKLGYQLLTFRAEPWPAGQESGMERKMTAANYSPERYKGVDFKV